MALELIQNDIIGFHPHSPLISMIKDLATRNSNVSFFWLNCHGKEPKTPMG